MQQTVRQETFPVFVLKFGREETTLQSVDAICAYFRARIEAHPCAVFIAEFDHFAHTSALGEGRIGEGIRAAKNVVYCFGIALPEPEVLAVRPRSIGVAETEDGFLVTFMEAPMPVANGVVEDWARGLCDLEPRSPLPEIPADSWYRGGC
ncbi:DUF6858 family protein [Lamprocystis purpurea]|uniref:DUF6858 family protein n=1 Tax=Lamprocystis purpurea TaxID=61598 RepID=UPI00036B559E|nr:hypothetical protein [Lamprocystis purpurea]